MLPKQAEMEHLFGTISSCDRYIFVELASVYSSLMVYVGMT